MINRSELKSHAKDELRGKWGLAVGGFFLATLILEVVGQGLNIISGKSLPLILISFLATTIITAVMSVGMCRFALNYATNGGTPAIEDLFSGFKVILKALGVYFLVLIIIVIGFILLIVPGIILSFMFSQVFYILADDNSKSIIDCLKESAAMMKGYKFNYFVLSLSFLGWLILGIIPLFIGLLWVIPYMNVTMASFYLNIKNNYYAVTENTNSEF
ncbi:membrane protein [Clostridium gelidum]|uniref:Membrane protein n=1 Tax=Clostridium gelidum TaxID=704125 RepID=A0ABN6IVN6_9CLOT|nr:DUF975 family protein [Clostridium gelidum]BCZ46225.1 membrane protein [Clostridium gelidum]